ncbi:rRNA-processing protein EBP2 [Talaromyces islandicus]|uniref:rRNA-processing protein EBP2 n=1 Tax=Talaromyces islandicus TaxID=28573 RepID=A0A0U1M544_TALIS|nr:rRNA-processing protein EBP2 [Talaromyces islandicus]
MAKRSKLLSALDAHKGRDFAKEKQKKLAKAAEKKKASKQPTEDIEIEEEQKEEKKPDAVEDEAEEEVEEVEEDGEENEEEEDDIALSDLSGDERADVIPHQRLTINNSAAINTSIKRISFVTPNTAFSEHNSLISTEALDVPDANDDLTRELAFYKVCQSAAVQARRLLKKEGIPFTRPADYFAEMVKTDEEMNQIKKKLYDEAASKKASADARRQRDLKKFGKQVQVAKLQQRAKEKRDALEKINSLKRKRKTDTSATTGDDDLFDISVDNSSKPESRAGGVNSKRQKKNEKYGFGGKKRFAKSGDAASSSDLRGFSVKKMKAGGKRAPTGAAKRPGKSRRNAMK